MKPRVGTTKKIFLDTAWKEHSLLRELASYPPDGYEFLTGSSSASLFHMVGKASFVYELKRVIMDPLIPLNLLKSIVDRVVERRPPGVALTYASQHLVFRLEPWVLEVELVHALAGGGRWNFNWYRGLVERTLASSHCKRIITWTEAGKKTLLTNLNCTPFADKMEVVYIARRPNHGFDKRPDHSSKVKLLFVNSSNIPGQFDMKGGKEVVNAFINLKKEYDNLELVLRSDVPPSLKKQIQGVAGLKLMDQVIPWESLEQEFKTADIYLFPSHITPTMSILDAMSYELPVVTIDAYANAELVEDGKTGFVVRRSSSIPYDNFYFGLSSQRGFFKAVKQLDEGVVRQLTEKVSTLIVNPELRRKMGKAGRWEVEHGKFSIEKRNEKLKKIFDEATS